jgi:methionyl-tRNA formyltransferase
MFAEKYGIDYLKHENINSNEFIKYIKKYNCDLFISMSFDQIFKREIINLPKHKIINCHAGKLPFYRGRNVLNWVLINDEEEFGITVHYVSEGIDTGDIILQRTFPITDNDNYFTLLNKAYIECSKILFDSVKLIQNGSVKLIKQQDIHPIGFYCGRRQEGDEVIDWNQTSRELFNFIRAICKPGPMAQSKVNNKIIKINNSTLIENACIYKGTVGQVVGKSEKGLYIKTKDTVLHITEYYYDGKIKIGDRLK